MPYPRPMLTPDRRRARTVASTGGGGDQCPVVTGGNVDTSGPRSTLTRHTPEADGGGLGDLSRGDHDASARQLERDDRRRVPFGRWLCTCELSWPPNGLQEWRRTRYVLVLGLELYAWLNWIA